MTNAGLEPTRMAHTPATRSIAVRQIRFVPHPVTGTRIRRKFKQPRSCLAVEQSIELAELTRLLGSPESIDSLLIVYVPPEAKEEWERIGSEWLSPKSGSESPEIVTISVLNDQIHWRPGLAVVEGNMGLRDEVIAALTEFAFYEGEVRALEQAIETYDAQARLDVPKTIVVKKKDRSDWARFIGIMESLTQHRITFAALEPRVEKGSRMLKKQNRAIATRLFRAADTSIRMEGLDGRLEVCEELYDGAIDRIADYRGWHTGHVLEVIIIALLLLEAGFMAAELIIRMFE